MYKFTAGETVWFGLENTDGATVTSVESKLFKSDPKLATVPQGNALFTFSAELKNPLAEGLAAGWLFSLNPTQTAGLDAGNYTADVKVTLSGGFVIITERFVIIIGD